MSGLEDLPLEVIEIIANYFSTRDLSHCCAVSRIWRQVFGSDILWKKRCNKNAIGYLKVTKCQVEPHFSSDCFENVELAPVSDYRMCFFREAHLWRNWRSGHFRREEIEFDCDDTISYNIKINFFGNDHVLLHTTYETQVWDVSSTPCIILTIPFHLCEMWENNLYNVVENRLVVVQCNVVQVFNISLESKSSSLAFAFFFDKPEDFSSNISEDKIDETFQKTSFAIVESFERIISGHFFVGAVNTKECQKNPVIHIWDLRTGKKVKEELCPKPPQFPFGSIELTSSDALPDKIIVSFTAKRICNILYNLTNMNFMHNVGFSYGEQCIVLKKFWCLFEASNSNPDNPHEDSLSLIDISSYSSNEPYLKQTFSFCCPSKIRSLNDRLLLESDKDIMVVNPEDTVMEKKVKIDLLFILSSHCADLLVIKDKFIAVHDENDDCREIWKIGKPSQKILVFPPDFGSYRTVNESCTKMVFERANKLIVLNLW